MEAMTINLYNLNFPDGSVVKLNSSMVELTENILISTALFTVASTLLKISDTPQT